MSAWLELGPNNYVLETEGSLLNTGLVVGSELAMVIDTGCGPRQGREILAAVREKTQLPLVVVNTHAHYDHFFGNAVFADDGVTEFWAHANCAATIEKDADNQRRFVATNEPEMAAGEGDAVDVVVPNALVHDQPVLVDLGGITATLFTWGGRTPTVTSWSVPAPLFTWATWWSRGRIRRSRTHTLKSGQTPCATSRPSATATSSWSRVMASPPVTSSSRPWQTP